MSEKPYSLTFIDFIRFGIKRRKIILYIALVAAIITAIIMLFKKNTYQAYGAFFPSANVISGRVNLFRDINQEWVDVFGEENEADRAYVIGNTSAVIAALVNQFKMYDHYAIDVKNDPQGMQKVFKKFVKNYSFSRSGFKHLEVTFKDTDDSLAAEIVNAAMNETDKVLKGIYTNGYSQIAKALEARTDSLDNQIAVLTDTLVKLRTTYGIYDLISPGRRNLINGKLNGSGEGFARGLENLQVVEEVKDKLVVEKGRYVAIANEFRTSANYEIPMIHVVQWASRGAKKAGPYRTLTVIGVFFGAMLFSWLLLVLYEYLLKNKEIFTADV